MNRLAQIALAAIFAMTAGLAAAQAQPAPQSPAPKPPSPEQMQQMMQTTMGAMVPVMVQMSTAMIEAQLAAAVKPETAERLALFKRNLYEQLLKQGFTAQQAVEIVVATPAPSASLSSK